MVDQWLPGPRKRIKASTVARSEGNVLIVLDPHLFSIRDKKGKVTDTYSELMLTQASDLYDRVLIFCVYGKSGANALKELVESIDGLNNIEFEECSDKLSTATETLKRHIIALGGRIKHVKNPREINHLNLHKFVIGEHIKFSRVDDWEKVGLKLDKTKSFDDLTKARKGKSFW